MLLFIIYYLLFINKYFFLLFITYYSIIHYLLLFILKLFIIYYLFFHYSLFIYCLLSTIILFYLNFFQNLFYFIFFLIFSMYNHYFQPPLQRQGNIEVVTKLPYADNVPAEQTYWVFSIGALTCLLLLRIFLYAFSRSASPIPNFPLKETSIT